MLLPGTSLPAAFRLAQGAVRAVERLGMLNPDSAHGCVTISAGVSAVGPDELDMAPDELIEAADQAMYAAKAAGRNRADLRRGRAQREGPQRPPDAAWVES